LNTPLIKKRNLISDSFAKAAEQESKIDFCRWLRREKKELTYQTAALERFNLSSKMVVKNLQICKFCLIIMKLSELNQYHQYKIKQLMI
jgi:hypothetical protein